MPNETIALKAKVAVMDVTADTGRLMYMPGGVHSISCGLGSGAFADVTVKVDAKAAQALNRSLAEVNQANAPQRALFDKDHEGKEAMAWPVKFEWSDTPAPGIYATVEYSSLGKQYVDGKVMRAFSGSFFTDADLPKRAQVKKGQTYTPAAGKRGSPENPAELTAIDFPYAGTLTNDPAFRKILPLWAKNSGQRSQSTKQRLESIDQRSLEAKTTQTKGNMKDKAALQAKKVELEQKIPTLKAKCEADADNADLATQLQNAESELETVMGQLESIELRARNEAMEAEVVKARTATAEAAVKAAVKRGALPAQDEDLQKQWVTLCLESPEKHLPMLAKLNGAAALQTQRITIRPDIKIQREDSQVILAEFARETDPKKRAALYATEIRKRLAEGDPLPLRANNNLGTLAGTLVSQRTLELLKLQFPILGSISTDFSDQQSRLNQTIDSRIISIPAVQDYDANNGWPDSDAIATDVPVTLNKQKGVQITFTADVLSSTVRRLFDEFGAAQAYALAKAMVDDLYALFLAANYTNAAIAAALIDFGRGTLIDAGVALDGRGVPDGPMNRFCLLNSQYFGQLKKDPAIVSLSAFQDKTIIEQGVLPDVEGFRVIKAVNMPATANLVGFSGSRSSALIATRVDSDYTTVLPGASYGNVTTVTDPDIGLSVLQVQFVNHQKASASQRISFLYGVAKGQNNAGQLHKSA